MTNSQHTPGPWRISSLADNDGSKRILHMVDEDNSTLIGSVALTVNGIKNRDRWHAEDEIREANARLIAAAPELLERLIALTEMPGINRKSGAWIDARAAIAKATGGENA